MISVERNARVWLRNDTIGSEERGVCFYEIYEELLGMSRYWVFVEELGEVSARV